MSVIGSGLAIGLIIFILIIFLIVLSASILTIIGKWKLFKKAGKKGWEAIIPYYNVWTLVDISGCKWWFFLIISLAPMLSLKLTYNIDEMTSIFFDPLYFIRTIIDFIAMLCVNYNISKKCNKDICYAIGLTILPFIFYPILGLGNTKFDFNVKVSPYGVIKEGEN